MADGIDSLRVRVDKNLRCTVLREVRYADGKQYGCEMLIDWVEMDGLRTGHRELFHRVMSQMDSAFGAYSKENSNAG